MPYIRHNATSQTRRCQTVDCTPHRVYSESRALFGKCRKPKRLISSSSSASSFRTEKRRGEGEEGRAGRRGEDPTWDPRFSYSHITRFTDPRVLSPDSYTTTHEPMFAWKLVIGVKTDWAWLGRVGKRISVWGVLGIGKPSTAHKTNHVNSHA